MVKKLAVWTIFMLNALPNSAVLATTYDAKYINQEGKPVKCVVNIDNNNLRTTYIDYQYQNLNLDINGKQIKSLAAGEKASLRLWQNVTKAVVFSPLALLGLLRTEKFAVITLAYTSRNSPESNVTTFSVNQQYSFQLMEELEAISGLKFESDTPKASQR